MTAWTPFPELDHLLHLLVSGIRSAMGEGLVGVYLQGSFALGDADVHSDVDFIAVTECVVTAGQLDALQTMHGRLHRVPNRWASHLEGSYLPRGDVRRRGPEPRSFPYLDNGSHTLISDPHCDTQIVRWVVRERGVILAGPAPATLIDPVGPDQLRGEMDGVLAELLRYAGQPSSVGRMSCWMQTFLVTTLCRILDTAATGTVVSKRAALEWARDRLPNEWRDLVQRAIDDRPDPWRRVRQAADDRLVDRTLAFADWVVAQGAQIDA